MLDPPRAAHHAGDYVVIDFGATFEGYRSDMTRTFCIGGDPAGELAGVFTVVAEAQAAGLAKVRAGVEAGAVDGACREVIARAGWAEAFEHGTGHGVGLDIHEAPGRSRRGPPPSWPPVRSSRWNPVCTYPGWAGSGSRTRWW